MGFSSGEEIHILVLLLAAALANAAPDQQRTILGENLYSLVEQLEQDVDAKVTGMILKKDLIEVLQLWSHRTDCMQRLLKLWPCWGALSYIRQRAVQLISCSCCLLMISCPCCL
ncbi:unnamed protein product [Linum tenue]|uniref:PABC domain-containing protein n=1 Tax=Linum tenue TaxID=586396 RepID=A0AAV0L7N2_9ROSI|nr:unnamed protein product [Linum tenue]